MKVDKQTEPDVAVVTDISSINPDTGWISCKDQLPEMGFYWGVIRHVSDGTDLMNKGEIIDYTEKVYRNWCAKRWQLKDEWVDVIYWMPILEIPRSHG